MINKIGLIAAMEKEKNALLLLLSEVKHTSYYGMEFIEGKCNNKEIILVLAGIGKVNAGMATTILIDHYSPEIIINTGIAGGYNEKLKPFDLLFVTSAAYSDVDAAVEDNEKYGQIPGMPSSYLMAIDKINNLDNIKKIEHVFFGKILSGDQFVTNYEKVHKIVNQYFPTDNVMAFDMEGTSVAQICYRMNIPCLMVKCISDIIGHTSLIEYNDFSYIASGKLKDIVIEIINQI